MRDLIIMLVWIVVVAAYTVAIHRNNKTGRELLGELIKMNLLLAEQNKELLSLREKSPEGAEQEKWRL